MKMVAIFISVFVFIGCSALALRTVKENTFYSKSPKINIRVSPEFDYLGMERKIQSSFIGQQYLDYMGYNYKKESDHFGPQFRKEIYTFKCSDKFLIIAYFDNFFMYPITFDDTKRYFITDREEIHNAVVIYAIEYDKDTESLVRHVAMHFGEVVGKEPFIYLMYVETVPYSARFPYLPSDWGSYNQLASEQKERVEVFQKNYDSSITFFKY